MATTYTYYKQSNGVDSWIAVDTDGDGQVTSKYMVYEDPNKKETIRNFEKLSTEDIATFKGLIGVTGVGGGSVTLTSGEGINVVDNGNGNYTIESTQKGENTVLQSGEGISVTDNGGGYWTIDSTAAGGSIKLMADKGIIVREIDGGYSIGIDFKAISGTGQPKGYTGVIPVFDGKSTNFLDFQNGILVSVKGDGAEMPVES